MPWNKAFCGLLHTIIIPARLDGLLRSVGLFVFTSEIEKLIKSNRVKDGVIVCEIGIRVRDAKRVTSVFQSFPSCLTEYCCKLTSCMI